MLTGYKQDCLNINGTESVRLENVTTEFNNYFKQISASLKIYADFESNLESVENMCFITEIFSCIYPQE